MKFLFITPENPLSHTKGGVASYISKISYLLNKRGHSVTILTIGDKVEGVNQDGICYLNVKSVLNNSIFNKYKKIAPLGYVVNAYRLAKKLKSYSKKNKIDLVQIANLKLVGLFIPRSGNYRKVVRISTSRKLYYKFGNFGNKHLSSILERLEVFIMKRSDKVYAPSQLMADYYSSNYNLSVDIIRPPIVKEISVDVPPSVEEFKIPSKYFLFVGSVSKRKGFFLLLNAFKMAIKKEPNIQLVVVGDFNKRHIKLVREALTEENIDRIIFLGVLQKKSVFQLIKSSEATILPSLVDNLPNTAIESLTLRVPVVSCYGSSIDELIEEGKSGYLFQRDDIPAFSGILIKIWKNQHTCKKNQIEYSPVLKEMISDAPLNRLEYLCQ